MLDIEKAFNPETKSIHVFYQSPGVGFYIPLYQRDYSWDIANIDQLLDDISKGIENLVENDNKEIRFLGTIITVIEQNKRGIEPQDPQGLPPSIEKVIDGQQRLSTIALLATQLYNTILGLEKKISTKSEVGDQLREICRFWKDKLVDVFSLDLKRGTPVRKPKIIRGNKDAWTKDGSIDKFYFSSVSRYLAEFIEYIFELRTEAPKRDKKDKVGQNIHRINSWLKNIVLTAHVNDSDDFAPAWDIVQNINQDYVWAYDRPDLEAFILEEEARQNKKSDNYLLCSFVQVFAVCHYLLDRCCFTIIQPINDDWAFDMFQSLNATGTPLTAIETFQPIVVQVTNNNNESYKQSKAASSFEKIDELFRHTQSAAKKSKLASDFLTSFRIVIDGGKLASHFSEQRKWLDRTYNTTLKNYGHQCRFIDFFGNYADFYKNIWQDYTGERGVIERIASHQDAELASLLVLYLKESNHKMAITVLASFYDKILDGKEDSISDFVEACKALGRFYTLWRSAKNNAGLDNVYREFFKGNKDNTITASNWLIMEHLEIDHLKSYLQTILVREGIENKENWLPKALRNLKYNQAKSVCKLALFIAAHETIVDDEHDGLMKIAKQGTYSYLNLNSWNSDDLKTIEHVAPVNQKNTWDENLYQEEDEVYQSIGNLTLLPTRVNSSAGNKGWKEKFLYYKHLCEPDLQKQQELATKAANEGIELNSKSIELLQSAKYGEHIAPIVQLGENGNWDAIFVQKRAERVCEILWRRIETLL